MTLRVLAPAQSTYDKTVYCNSYEIADLLRKGMNTVVALMGNGLWAKPKMPQCPIH
jgi:hypothetical protein